MKSISMVICTALMLAACGAERAVQSDAADAHGHAHEETGGGHEAHSEGEEHHEADRGLVLNDEQIRAAEIEVLDAGGATIHETVPLYGVVTPNAERMREVIARYPGVIRSVTKQVGDAVRRGEPLATVESDESLETYAVNAPIDGVITARHVNPGEQSGGKVLFTVTDLSTVWVDLALFARDLSRVRVGQPVRVRNAAAEAYAEGKIVYVSPLGSAASQTLTARVLLDNAERRWAPGLHVTAEVMLAQTQVAVAIRNQAIQTLDGRTIAFVRTGSGFEPRTLALGRADTEHSEVLEGLAEGEIYAARNSFVLKAEMKKGEAEHDH